MRKLSILRTLLIILFLVFIYFYFKPSKYEKEYVVDNYNIKEKYDDNYYFNIYNDEISFDYVLNKEYSPKRKLIKNISTYKKNNHYCIYIEIEKIKTYPQCYEGKEKIDFRLISGNDFDQFLYNKYKKDITIINKKIDDITLFYNTTIKFAIWNYKGIDYISNEVKKKADFFKEDIYDNNLVKQVGNYIFIPNYNKVHSFDEVYIFNLITGEYNTWKLKTSIYYESYILGSLDNKLYLVDKKEEIEYELNLEKQEINIVSNEEGLGKIYDNGWKDITINKLVNNELKFTLIDKSPYIIKNGYLYNKLTATRLSNVLNPILIKYDDTEAYYLKGDILYYYSDPLGEIKILKKEEWKYNYQNKIFVYNQQK